MWAGSKQGCLLGAVANYLLGSLGAPAGVSCCDWQRPAVVTQQITVQQRPHLQKQVSGLAIVCCRYAEAEKTNGRWAMMAVAGILGQELLGVTPEWWNAGAKDYGVPMAPLTAMEFLVSSSC